MNQTDKLLKQCSSQHAQALATEEQSALARATFALAVFVVRWCACLATNPKKGKGNHFTLHCD